MLPAQDRPATDVRLANSQGVQQQNAATAAYGTDAMQPPKSSDLRQ